MAMSKTREQFPLSSKKPLKKTTSFIITIFALFVLLAVILGISTIGIEKFFNLPRNLVGPVLIYGSLFLILLCFLIYKYQVWYFQTYFYELTDDFVIIRKGVFTPKEITIPYERIQDVYVDQDILDRIFGLYDVHISSATISSGIEAHIDGVEKEAAEGLRNVILKRLHEKIQKPPEN
jgi:putative membrane protein